MNRFYWTVHVNIWNLQFLMLYPCVNFVSISEFPFPNITICQTSDVSIYNCMYNQNIKFVLWICYVMIYIAPTHFLNSPKEEMAQSYMYNVIKTFHWDILSHRKYANRCTSFSGLRFMRLLCHFLCQEKPQRI